MSTLLYLNGTNTDDYEDVRVAQSFTPTRDWFITAVWCDSIWAAAAVTCYICADASTKPGAELASSDAQTVAAGTPGGAETFTFAPYRVTGGVLYWLSFYAAADGAFRRGGVASAQTGVSKYNAGVWGAADDFDAGQLKIIGAVAQRAGRKSFTTRSGVMYHRR